METALIIGTGIAGVSAAAAMRSAGHEGEIVLIGAETDLPYRRPPLSKELLRGEKDADAIRIKKQQWYEDQRVDLRLGNSVTEVHAAAAEVTLDDGALLGYDKLLLATGGRSRSLPGVGPTTPGVRTLRALADVPALQADLETGTPVVVVGAGLIGSELAASARSYGCEVTLLESASLPLTGVLPEAVGRVYADLHRNQGVDLHTGVLVRDVSQSGSDVVVTAQDGRTWTAPLVVVAVGMLPATELAENAGLAVHDGVTVDAAGRTSAPGIYAAGDVANMPNAVIGHRHRVEHWQNAQNHGTAVGKAMAGRDVEFAEVPWCWSDQYGHTLQITGWPESRDQVVVRGDLATYDFTAVFVRDGRLIGAIGIGRPGDIRAARKAIAKRAAVDVPALADESVPVPEAVLD